jgi:nitrous oxidase accessory protein
MHRVLATPHGGAGRRVLALVTVLLLAGTAGAATYRVLPGEPLPTHAAGDELVLVTGTHTGPWRIDAPDVTLRAEPGAVLDGGGGGSALTLAAPGVRVVGLRVVGVGPDGDLYAPDAAFRLDGCHGCRLESVRAGAPGDGVSAALWIEAADDVRVVGLTAFGSGVGPGVTTFEAPGLVLERVHLEGFLDGLYLERSDGLRVLDASLLGSRRYGVHLMFNRDARLERVRAADGGVGSAVMYGRGTELRAVVFEGHTGPMAFGLLIQEEHDARIEGATLRGNTLGLLAVAAPGLVVAGAEFDANGFGAVLQRLPAAFDARDADLDTTLSIEASRFRRNAFDLALDDDGADVRLHGNAYDRAPPLDLDGDGTLDAPYVVGTSLGALAARVPDVSLLAFGPAMVLWEAFEARVPGVRFGLLVDHSPRALEREPSERAALTWLLALLPAAGAAWALRSTWSPVVDREGDA